jgi:hypothetical protein
MPIRGKGSAFGKVSYRREHGHTVMVTEDGRDISVTLCSSSKDKDSERQCKTCEHQAICSLLSP